MRAHPAAAGRAEGCPTSERGPLAAGAAGRRSDLALALGLARRAALLIATLAEGERPDWRRVRAAAAECSRGIEALAAVTGAAPERRDLRQLLRAQRARALDALQEARPERLAAFGALSADLRADVAARLAVLWPLLAELGEAIAKLPPADL